MLNRIKAHYYEKFDGSPSPTWKQHREIKRIKQLQDMQMRYMFHPLQQSLLNSMGTDYKHGANLLKVRNNPCLSKTVEITR